MSRPGVTVTVTARPGPVAYDGPLVIGPRYSSGLDRDPDTGQFFIDPTTTGGPVALKTDTIGRPFAETDPEPRALTVGLNGTRPFYEKD